jgi:hypothetical protein
MCDALVTPSLTAVPYMPYHILYLLSCIVSLVNSILYRVGQAHNGPGFGLSIFVDPVVYIMYNLGTCICPVVF